MRPEMAQIRELKIAHHCNLAVCHMKHGPNYSKAKENCTKALAIDGSNVKGARTSLAHARSIPAAHATRSPLLAAAATPST